MIAHIYTSDTDFYTLYLDSDKKRNIPYLLHHTTKPTCIIYDDDGNIEWIEWYTNNLLHQNNGPASIYFNKRLPMYSIHWYKMGEYHREDGPAIKIYHASESISTFTVYHNIVIRNNIPYTQFIFYNKDKYPNEYNKILKKEVIDLFD